MAAALALALGAKASAQQVRVEQGVLAGSTAGDVASYKGIPYAAAPLGALRWRAPKPPPVWKGVRQASNYGPVCLQFANPANLPPGLSQSEDCLNLNVWAPAKAPAKPLPVMVWIHGGGFVRGSGAAPFVAGGRFPTHGVVLVTLNYRLGALGFFAHPALTREAPKAPLGDYGLMDQIEALRWVKRNIARFGGDPSKVTIFGESAGGISVNHLLVAPSARGLFAQAISQSGFGRSAGPVMRRVGTSNLPNAETRGEAFARALGVEGEGPDAARKLRALPAERLLQQVFASGQQYADVIIDGVLIPQPVADAFRAGKQAKLPFMLGGTSWEASLFDFASKDPERVLRESGERAEVLARFDPTGKRDPARAAQDYLTDSSNTEPARYLAKQMLASGQPTFVYQFSYLPPSLRSKLIGAPHGFEIGYVFSTLPKQPVKTMSMGEIPAATSEDTAIADAMNDYWTAFATRGVPASPAGPTWPAFALDSQAVLDFAIGGPVVRTQFQRERLDWLEQKASRPPTGPAAEGR